MRKCASVSFVRAKHSVVLMRTFLHTVSNYFVCSCYVEIKVNTAPPRGRIDSYFCMNRIFNVLTSYVCVCIRKCG